MPDFNFIIYIGCYVAAGSFLTAMISYNWINRKLLNLDYSLPLLIASWVWLTSQLFEYIIPGLTQKIMLHTIQFTGISVIPLFWVIFCLKRSETRRSNAGKYRLLSLPAVVLLVIMLTNPLHKQMWKNFVLHISRAYLVKEFGIGIWLLFAYVFIYFTAGFILMLRKALRTNRYEKKQLIIILFMAFVPFSAVIADYFSLVNSSYVMFTPLAIAGTSLFMLYFVRIRYYRSIPITQHLVTESLLDVCIILNPDNLVIYCNPPACNLIGLQAVEMVGKPLVQVFSPLYRVIEKEQITNNTSFDIVLGSYNYHISISPIYKSNNRIINWVLILRDITSLKKTEESLRQMKEQLEILVKERTRALEQTNAALIEEIKMHNITEEKLNNSLAEKNILMGEIHHRVKNNLQVIISMLKLQKQYIKDEKGLEGFNTAISRIKAIAIIHEKLYKSDDLANTNLAEYIRDLVRYLTESHKQENKQIDLNLSVDNIYLDLDRSIVTGLIINELVTNAFKYAFPRENREQPQHEIQVYFRQEGADYILGVKDNGVGLPAGLDITRVDSLGMKIVFTLANQLSGELSIARQQGTEISIRFAR